MCCHYCAEYARFDAELLLSEMTAIVLMVMIAGVNVAVDVGFQCWTSCRWCE